MGILQCIVVIIHQSHSLLHSVEDLHGNTTLHPGLDGLGAALSFHCDPFQFQSVRIYIWIHDENKMLVRKKELFVAIASPRTFTVVPDNLIT